VVCSKTGPWKTSQEDISDQTRGKKKNGKTKNEMAGRFWKGSPGEEGGKMAAEDSTNGASVNWRWQVCQIAVGSKLK